MLVSKYTITVLMYYNLSQELGKRKTLYRIYIRELNKVPSTRYLLYIC